jgi:cell shape-determining protein MreC
MGFLSASVSPAGQTQNQLIINRGRKAGVAVGQFVASPDGSIVGAVTETSPQVATVRLITDPASKIQVYIGDPNVRGIMEGQGNGLARIPLISDKPGIRVGDRVYVEKKTGVLDVPVLAAEVTQYGKDLKDPVLSSLTVRPVCDMANLSEVTVLIPAARRQ